MTVRTPRRPLEAAVDAAEGYSGTWHALALLASLGTADPATPAGQRALAWLAAFARPQDEVVDDLRLFVAASDPGASVPEDPQELGQWLVEVESLGLASLACDALGDAIPGPLRAAIALACAVVDARRPELATRTWDHPIVAAHSRDPGPEVMPWTFIRSRRARGTLDASTLDAGALEAWRSDALHVEDACMLAEFVRGSGPWQAAYREAVQRDADAIDLPHRASDRSTAVAATMAERAWATRLLRVPVPHRGLGVHYEVVLGQHGVFGRFDDEPLEAGVFAAASSGALVWGDAITGELRTPLRLLDPSTLEVLEDVAHSIAQLTHGEQHPRAEPIACATAKDLESGLAHRALAEAARVFDSGDDGHGDDPHCAAAVLRTRVALQAAGDRIASDALDEAVRRADRALDPHANGLLLLEPATYRRILEDEMPPPGAWWGRPGQLDAELSTAAVLAALAPEPAPPTALQYIAFREDVPAANDRAEGLRVVAAASDGPLGALALLEEGAAADQASFDHAYRTALARFLETPALWRQPEIATRLERLQRRFPERHALLAALVHLSQPRPGTVLIPVVSHASAAGVVLEARLRHSRAAVVDRVGPIAHQAIERAFTAAAESSPRGPRYAFEDHAIEFIGPADLVEGASLALPLALAFASLWLDEPLATGISATGDLDTRGPAEVGVVDGVAAKAAALDQLPTPTRLLCHPDHAITATRLRVRGTSVSTLDEALTEAGLDWRRATFEPAWGDVQTRVNALTQSIREVQFQDLGHFEHATDPWLALAERMRLVIRSLVDELPPGDLDDARIHCALAYAHAARPDLAIEVTGNIPDLGATHGALAITRAVVDLGTAIDHRDWPQCSELSAAIDARLKGLPRDHREAIFGMARGAQGRALLHRGDAVAALPLLVEARDFHASHRRYELARSRITVAACLRIQGRTHDALGELDDATAELRETRRRSVSYADATAAFLEYERARVLVEIGDGLDAYRVAMRALEICGRGAWPRLGILRTLAWAHRLLGDPRSAEACVEQMRALDLGDARELRERLIDEASGPPRSDGEVY